MAIENLDIQISSSADRASQSIDSMIERLTRLQTMLTDVASRVNNIQWPTNAGAGGGFDGLREAANNANSLGEALNDVVHQAGGLAGAAGQAENLGNSMANAANRSNLLMSALGGVARATYSVGAYFVGQGVSSVRRYVSSLGNLFSSLKRIAMYRIIRTVIKEITQGFAEGQKNLYNWSKSVGGTFATNMNTIATASQYLKNSLAAMASPLYTAVAPAIDYIVDKFVDMFNFVNQLFARLSGATTYTVAKKVAATWGDASKSAGATAAAAKRTILSFDEINKLTSASSGSGGSGGSGSSGSGMFETQTIDQGVSTFADSLKEAFQNQDWEGLGTLLGNKVNELVEKIDWSGLGTKVGTYINGWFSTKYWTLETINFTNIGSKIAEFLNNAIEQIDFNILGRLAVQELTIVGDLIIGFFKDFDWGQASEKFSNYVTGIFQQLSKWIQKQNWVELGVEIVDSIFDAIVSFDYSGSLKSIAEFFGSVLGGAIALISGLGASIAEKIVEAFTGIYDYFAESVESCGGDIVAGILKGIITGLVNIGVWIVNNIFKPFIDGFKKAFGIASPASTMEEPGENIVAGIFEGIKNALKSVGTWVKENIFQPIWDAIKNAGETAIDIVVSLGKKVGDWASDVWDVLKTGTQTIKKTITAVAGSIADFAGAAWSFVKSGAQTIVKTVEGAAGKVAEFTGAAWTFIRAGALTIVKTVEGAAGKVADFAGAAWSFIRAGAMTIIKTVEGAAGKVADFAGAAWTFIKSGAMTIIKTVEGAAGKVADFTGAAWSFIRSGAMTIIKTVEGVAGTVADFAGAAWSFIKAGSLTVIKTVEGAAGSVADFAGDVWDWIREGSKTITKTVQAGMSKLNTWNENIVNFITGTDSPIKTLTLKIVEQVSEWFKSFWEWLTGGVTIEPEIDLTGDVTLNAEPGEGFGAGSDSQAWYLSQAIQAEAVVEALPETTEWDDYWANINNPSVEITPSIDLNTWSESMDAWAEELGIEVPVSATVTTAASTIASSVKSAWGKLQPATRTLSFLGSVGTAASTVASTFMTGWNKLTGGRTVGFLGSVSSAASTVANGFITGWNKLTGGRTLGFKGTINSDTGTVASNWISLWNKLTTGRTVQFKNTLETNPSSAASNWVTKWKNMSEKDRKVYLINSLTRTGSNWSGDKGAKKWWEKQPGTSGVSLKTSLTNKGTNWASGLLSFLTGNKDGLVSIALSLGGTAWSLIKSALHTFGVPGFAKGGIINAFGFSDFANGGILNPHGTLFRAGENGAEVVGHIGGRTEVLNRSQLASTMYQSVRAAMAPAFAYDAAADEGMSALAEYMMHAVDAAMSKDRELMRQQNEYLRQINDKEFTAEITTAAINNAQNRSNRRAGTPVAPVAVG